MNYEYPEKEILNFRDKLVKLIEEFAKKNMLKIYKIYLNENGELFEYETQLEKRKLKLGEFDEESI
jgi:hypothetical protein